MLTPGVMRTVAVATAVFCLGLSLDGSPANAAAKYTAKLSLDVQKGNPKEVVASQFADKVRQATKGEVDIQVFPNSVLGGEREAAEGIRLGSVQMGILTSSVLTSWMPALQVLDLPFLFNDDAHAIAVNRPLTKALSKDFEAQGFRLLGFSINGARELMSRFAIEKPADVKGKKMRVLQSPIHIALWKAVGANPVPIPAPEVYNSLQTGVVDFFDNTATNYLTFKFFEVAPYYIKLDHVYAMGTWVVAEAWWKRLPAEYQTIIADLALQSQDSLPALQQKEDDAALAETQRLGAKIHVIKDKSEWRNMMKPVWSEFSAKIPNAKESLAIVEAAAKKP
jgi:tripartite ATP-independent transporter DctP family solute receptor